MMETMKGFLWLLTCCKGIQWDDYTFIHKMSISHQMPTWDIFHNLRWWDVSIFWDDLVYFLLRSAFAILSLQKSDRRQDFNLWPFHQFVFCLSKKLVGLFLFLSARSDFHLSPLKSSQLYQFFFCRMEKFSSSVKLQSGRLWAIFAAVISCIRAKSCTKFAFKLNITFWNTRFPQTGG